MSARYDERDYERNRINYGRRSTLDYDRSYGESSPRRYRYDDRDVDSERYGQEGEYGGRYSSYPRRYPTREGYAGHAWQNEAEYWGGPDRGYPGYGRPYDEEDRYADRPRSYSQRYNYPTGFRSGRTSEPTRYRRDDYGTDYGYGRGGYEQRGYGRGEERGWWDRTSDEVASWFGDEEAEHRRRLDRQRESFRGRGPKGYRRSDERIKEDVNDRLSDDLYLDASDIEVAVANTEVTLTGSVSSRRDKWRAEDIAESVSGVTNVENRLRVTESSLSRYTRLEATGSSGMSGTSTTPTGTASRSRGAGN